MVEIDGEKFPDSKQADELLDILYAPLGHVDTQFEVEKMGYFAFDRNFKRTMCPYYKDTQLDNKFRRTWSEEQERVVDRESFFPAAIWLMTWDDQQEDSHIRMANDSKLRW